MVRLFTIVIVSSALVAGAIQATNHRGIIGHGVGCPE